MSKWYPLVVYKQMEYFLSYQIFLLKFTKGSAYCALHCYVYKTITVRMEMGWLAAIKWANKNKWSLVKLLPGMASGFLLQFMIKYVTLAYTKLPMEDFIHLWHYITICTPIVLAINDEFVNSLVFYLSVCLFYQLTSFLMHLISEENCYFVFFGHFQLKFDFTFAILHAYPYLSLLCWCCSGALSHPPPGLWRADRQEGVHGVAEVPGPGLPNTQGELFTGCSIIQNIRYW